MRQFWGGALVAAGIAGPVIAVWWLFASGHMERYPATGARAFAGLIGSGIICTFIGVAIWLAPRSDR